MHKTKQELPEIPVIETNKDWVKQAFNQQPQKALALLNTAQKRYPDFFLKLGDYQSKKWLKRNQSLYLNEMDQISKALSLPGVYFLNVSYEWGCTCKASEDSQNKSARLIRVLDWPDSGLGKNIIAVKINSKYGDWLSLTWPGFSGTLQAIAKGRFSAAINQAPMDLPTGWIPLDWVINRIKAWNSHFIPPAHLLRYVFETARDYSEAKQILSNTPIAVPAIFVLAGIRPNETCVIERRQESVNIIEGASCAANSWQKPEWSGCFRGEDNSKRLEMMATQSNSLDTDFSWLLPPIYNSKTRLAMICDAKTGQLTAQGFEVDGPATKILRMSL